MVVCKFFLQGTCKFGQDCRFQHSLGDNFHYVNPNIQQNQPQFTQQKPPQTTTTIDTLVESVVKEANAVEKGGQWLLTCYAPFKDKHAFPGLEDTSFEEVRWGFYEARENGTLDQYIIKIQEMMQTRIMQLKALQNPSPDIINIIKQIYDTPLNNSMAIAAVNRTGGFNSPNSTFTSPLKSNFNQQGGNTISGNIFGGFPVQNQPVFSGSQANYQQTPVASSSIFANTAQTTTPFVQQPPSIFGGQTTSPFVSQQNAYVATNNTFVNQQQQSSIFAQASPPNFVQTTSPSVFNQQLSGQTQTSPFFSQQPGQNPSVFSQQQQQSSNIFGTVSANQNSNNIFAQQSIHTPQNQQPFGAAQNTPTSPFGQNQPSSGSIFVQNSTFQQPSQGIFKTGFDNNTRTTVEVDMSVYSKLEDLTPDEINWFESDTLDVACIPENPPTFEMSRK
ncbi:uncharacterized protein LOC109599327 isoform X2 [Aethina tumida]|uniref:uncharacterized protein LOC109599327 isoform X2 n=1 Tax=Aethina tumida TaxID=116153 RepID=UPI0021494ED9|nr:uncharacterized protein LOC109599327 isoform X2 [Aethina tumida]